MAESAQQVARRVLADLDSLVTQGKLESSQIASLRSDLDSLANPAPPPIAARPASLADRQQRKRYRALWTYNGAQADELSFSKGDLIELTQEVSEGWWRGSVVRTSDNSLSAEGMFPSNYVEVINENAALVPALPPRSTNNGMSMPQPSPSSNAFPSAEDEKRATGLHATNVPQHQQHIGPPPWQPGVARWSSGGPPNIPPPPNHFSPPPPSPGQQSNNGSYYSQPPMPYGGNTPNAYSPSPSPYQGGPYPSGTQPMPPTEEEKKKHDKFKKFAGRMGETAAGGFAGGVGFGIGSHLFN